MTDQTTGPRSGAPASELTGPMPVQPPDQPPAEVGDGLQTRFVETGRYVAAPYPPAAQSPVIATDGQRDRVSCPECGAVQDVRLGRREAMDFCTNCDFPLFWTPSEVIRDHGPGAGEGLRRLPGTVGRTTLASAACPTCSELNVVSAETCVRCGNAMRPVVAPPAPEPVYVPPPPPPAPVEPEPGIPWWEWVLIGVVVAAVIAVVVLGVTGVIG